MRNLFAAAMSVLLTPVLSSAEPWAAGLQKAVLEIKGVAGAYDAEFKKFIQKAHHVNNAQIKGEDDAFAHLVEEAAPAVVMLIVEGKPGTGRPRRRMPKELEEFFKRFGPLEPKLQPGPTNPPPAPEQSEPGPTESGSGFIINYNGSKVVITNAHVVETVGIGGAVTIRFEDDTERSGKVLDLGNSDVLDLAIVTADDGCAGCSTVKLGDSGTLKRMHRVVAIGAPLGLTQTVTKGVVSHADRQGVPGIVAYHIQTDAAINMGNSGGPLFNTDGEVIGVNSLIISPSGGSIGLGLAIPSSEVKKMLDHYTRTGALTAPPSRMGIVVSLNKARQIEFAEPGKDSPAERAGLKKGDIVLEVDGRPAPKDVSEFVKWVKTRGVNETLRLQVKRGEQIVELSVVLEEAK